MGYEILTLILIDCVNPPFKRRNAIKLSYYNRLRNYLLNPDDNSLNGQLKLLITKSYIFLRRPVPVHRRNFYILANYKRATSRYNSKLFYGKVLLFKSEENIFKDQYLGWKEYVNGNIEVVDFKGDHLSIVDEYESTKLLSDQIIQKMSEFVNSSKD